MAALVVASFAAPLAGGVFLACLLSPGSAEGIAALPSMLVYGAVLGFPIAFLHALLLGVPLFLWFERRFPVNWWSAMVAGAMVAMLPALLWIGPALAWEARAVLMVLGASGAVGGLIFRVSLCDQMRAP